MMMISGDDEIIDDGVMLHESDFPKNFINKAHPTDYLLTDKPIKEFIFHKELRHSRLLLRISFKIDDNLFVPITLICDTGAPSSFYLCEKTRNLIKSRIKTSEELEIEYIKIFDPESGENKKMLIGKNPYNHSDINILGLRSLEIFGLSIYQNYFEFRNLPEYI